MTHRTHRSLLTLARQSFGVALAMSASTFSAHPAFALQPVGEFIAHAKTWNPRTRAAHATTAQRDAEVEIARGALLPNLSVTGMYTRNQYEVTTGNLFNGGGSSSSSLGSFGTCMPSNPSSQACVAQTLETLLPSLIPNTVIQPQDQFDANAILNVPLINIANWDRKSAAQATLAGAQADEANAELSVEKSVLRDYYTLLGDEAVLLSATKNLEIARNLLKLARDRKEGGTGSELDVQRAVADEAKAEQSVTAAQLGVTNTQRDLYTLSGLVAAPATEFPEDDLREEEPLPRWMGRTNTTPSVQSAVANRAAAVSGAHAVKNSLLPTLSAAAEEKLTNATAFVGGHSSVYLLQVTANWRLDTTLFAQNRAQNAAVAAARANEEAARQAAEDAVFRDWQQIRADIDSARSARAQVSATKLAASLAEDRYQSGVATQLDVLTARQDAFSADVARIQADADLAYARLALRLDAGVLADASSPRPQGAPSSDPRETR